MFAALMFVCVAPYAAFAQRAGGSSLAGGGATAEADIDGLSRAGEARASGPDTAKVVVLEFIDFACPTCRAFHLSRADSLRRAAGADVRIVYVTFLFADHPRSWHAAEAGICAGLASGGAGYSTMANQLFQNADSWKNARDPGPLFARYAKDAAVDAAAFADCIARDAAAPLILSDLETGGRLGVNGTPTFIIAPRGATSAEQTSRVEGDVPIAELLDHIAKARAKAK